MQPRKCGDPQIDRRACPIRASDPVLPFDSGIGATVLGRRRAGHNGLILSRSVVQGL